MGLIREDAAGVRQLACLQVANRRRAGSGVRQPELGLESI